MAEETTKFPASPEEVENILSEVVEPEEIRVLKTDEEKAIAMRIIPFLVAKVNKQLEVKRAKEMESIVNQIKTENAKLIEAELERIRDSAKPPDLKQIEQLLNQEYVEVKFSSSGKEFAIRELPQAAEQKFLQTIQKKLMPKLSQFTSIEWTNSGTVYERFQKVVDIFPDALNVMGEIVTVALNPFGDDKDVTQEWVVTHISTYRMYMIIQAQVEAGKMRDFILGLFRAIPGQMMT